MRFLPPVAAVAVLAGTAWSADPPKLLRSISGPSGKTIGSDFVIEEARNRFVPKRLSLTDSQQIFGFTFSPTGFQPGTYQVDLNWNGHAAWRTFIRITE